MFSNAKNVEINGKTVKSITLENGGILYNKKDEPYHLSITSNKDILSYYDNDVATLTVSLTKGGVPIKGETIVFSCNDVIETIEISSSGTYNFGDSFTIDCVNLPPNENYSSSKQLIIGNPSGNYLKIWRRGTDTTITIMKNDSGWGGFNDDIIIENGVLKAYQEEYSKYQTLNVSDIDLTQWTFQNISCVIPVETYFYETAVTDSNGKCSVSYNSKGMGDLNIKVECMNLQETYELEDLYDYDLTTYNSTTTSPLKLPKGNFELTYKSILKTNTAHNTNLNIYGVLNDDTTQVISEVISVIGITNRPDKAGFHTSFVVNEVWEEYWHSSPVTVNSEYIVKYIYNNGQHFLYVDGDLLIITSKIMKNMHDIVVGINYNEWIKDLKVKLLSYSGINNIVLTSDKSILSAYDNDTCTLTATVTGENVDGLEVKFYNGSTLLGSDTITNGVATYNYNSQAAGKVSFTAIVNEFSSEPCNVIDAKYYASNETINLAPRYNNDRILFVSDYQVQEGDKIHFRFKNITNHMLWGIGSTAGSDFCFEQVGTKLYYWRNVLNNSSYDNPSFLPTTENDYIFEYLKYDSTQWKVNIYIGDRYVEYWRCGHSIRKVRIDKYDNSDPSWDVEVFVL